MQTSAKREGYGLMRTKADKGEGESIFVIFLWMSFMDDSLSYYSAPLFYMSSQSSLYIFKSGKVIHNRLGFFHLMQKQVELW